MVPVSSTLTILFLFTSIFAVLSVHLFRSQDVVNFGQSTFHPLLSLKTQSCLPLDIYLGRDGSF